MFMFMFTLAVDGGGGIVAQHSRVTIGDVAARAGVAISSVSSALNGRSGVSEATRERIMAVAAEMGFAPSAMARSLSGKQAFAVGLVVHRDTEVLEQDPFFATFIAGVERCIDPRGYALVLQIGEEPGKALERYRRLAATQRVDGVFLDELTEDDPRVQLVQEIGLPAVAVNPDPDFPLPAVRQDCVSGIEDAVAHLRTLGHTSVAFVGGPPQFVHSRQREAAWRHACDKVGVLQGPVATGNFTFEGGAAAAHQLLSTPERPTAVLCVNDLSAMGLIAEAREMGVRVPRDVSVIGFDGVRMGALSRPSLSTITTTPAGAGFEAAEILLALIAGEHPSDVELAPAEFVARDSSGPVRHS
jgi:DNA-binding LacI/PurR family transcriptional regulator